MKNIRLLDCTLRDGAYITNSDFGDASIRGIISKMEDAGVEIIECGWLKDKEHHAGSTFFHVPEDIIPYIGQKKPGTTYVTMIDWDRYDLDNLPVCDGRSIDAIRVVFPYAHHTEGIQVARRVKEKGYNIYLQAANTLAYSNEDLEVLAAEINELKPVALSVVDTFGAMYPEDLDRIVTKLDACLDENIALGFHSHNNQQLAFALCIEFEKLIRESRRDGIIDSSLCGMGRGAGNATTELAASFLNRKCGHHYDLDAVMDAIDTYMEFYKERFQWGYSTSYFIAGMYCCHVNNIAYLRDNHRTGAKDMRNIIESLSPDDRKKYDYDLLEQKYLQNKGYQVDDSADADRLRRLLTGREVVLIAPGRSSLDKQSEIKDYIGKKNACVIGVNAILEGYDYDYVLFVNPARYDYAVNAHPEVFGKVGHILLSNVKNSSEDEIIINFNSVVKRGWKYYDNAVMCALRLFERLGLDSVALAGFDGFKDTYNLSYADEKLPSRNPGEEWTVLNEEITEMYSDFAANSDMKVKFLTESIYDR